VIKSINITLENGQYKWEVHKDLGELGNASYYGSALSVDGAMKLVQERMKTPEERLIQEYVEKHGVREVSSFHHRKVFDNTFSADGKNYLVKTRHFGLGKWEVFVLPCDSKGRVIDWDTTALFETYDSIEHALAAHVRMMTKHEF
jgi:hypothetical protein